MATEASRIHAEITNTITETLRFLQRHPKNLDFLVPVLPAFRITRRAIANFGKALPQKDIEWCRKCQINENSDELTPDATIQDHSSTADTITQDTCSRTDSITQDDSSIADITTQDSPLATDATPLDNCSRTDSVTQDDPSTADTHDNTSTAQDTFIANKKSRKYGVARFLIDDEVMTKFKGKDKDFNLWTHQPDSFWNLSTTQPNAFADEQSFFENTAKQPRNIDSLRFIHRLDSIIAYLRYKKKMPREQYIRPDKLKIFLKQIGIPTEQAPEQQEILQSGRRRLQFCHLLSKINAKFPECHYDDNDFDDINYGVLFLDIDDKIWTSSNHRYYDLMMKTIEDLEPWDINTVSEQSGAKSAAKALLQSRQASIETLSLSNENNSTTVSSDVEGNSSIVLRAEDRLDKTRASKRSRTEDHPDSTTASKRLRIEEILNSTTSEHARMEDISDGTTASEHVPTEGISDGTTASEHVPTEGISDGTTASEHVPSEEISDGTTASDHAPTEVDSWGMLLEAAAITGQNADASETIIANLVSDFPLEQLSSATSMSSMDEFYPEFSLVFSHDGQTNVFDYVDVHSVYEDFCNNKVQLSDEILVVPLSGIE